MGLWSGIIRLGTGALLFLGGYSYCRYVSQDSRYTIEREKERPYIVDKERRERLPIEEQLFQVGSLEHRVNGILHDPRLPKVLEEANYGK